MRWSCRGGGWRKGAHHPLESLKKDGSPGDTRLGGSRSCFRNFLDLFFHRILRGRFDGAGERILQLFKPRFTRLNFIDMHQPKKHGSDEDHATHSNPLHRNNCTRPICHNGLCRGQPLKHHKILTPPGIWFGTFRPEVLLIG